jgi:hypothetical protein
MSSVKQLCNICFSSQNSAITKHCGKSFHVSCLMSWQKVKRLQKCPDCRLYRPFTDICSICKRNHQRLEKLKCGHLFHASCLDCWDISLPTCPFCPFKPVAPPNSPIFEQKNQNVHFPLLWINSKLTNDNLHSKVFKNQTYTFHYFA